MITKVVINGIIMVNSFFGKNFIYNSVNENELVSIFSIEVMN